MHANGIVNWRLKSGETWLSSYAVESANTNDAWTEMDRTLTYFSKGRYTVEGSSLHFTEGGKVNKASASGRYKVEFDHTDGFGTMSGPAVQHQPAVDVAGEIARALADYDQKRELKDLKEKVSKLETEKEKLEKEIKTLEKQDPLTRIAGRLEPFIGRMIDYHMGANVPAPQIGDINTDDFDARLEKAFSDWNEVNEATKLVIIEKIASLSKADPQMYASARGILMTQK